MAYLIHTDGGIRDNTGRNPGAWAFVLRHHSFGTKEFSGFLTETTNNEAEYTALINALQWVMEAPVKHNVIIKTDSELMVKQLHGIYNVNSETLLPFWATAAALIEELKYTHGLTIELHHVKREFNPDADRLCNEVMDAHNIVHPMKGKKVVKK